VPPLAALVAAGFAEAQKTEVKSEAQTEVKSAAGAEASSSKKRKSSSRSGGDDEEVKAEGADTRRKSRRIMEQKEQKEQREIAPRYFVKAQEALVRRSGGDEKVRAMHIQTGVAGLLRFSAGLLMCLVAGFCSMMIAEQIKERIARFGEALMENSGYHRNFLPGSVSRNNCCLFFSLFDDAGETTDDDDIDYDEKMRVPDFEDDRDKFVERTRVMVMEMWQMVDENRRWFVGGDVGGSSSMKKAMEMKKAFAVEFVEKVWEYMALVPLVVGGSGGDKAVTKEEMLAALE
jgi:hypothetical protein